MLTAEVSFDRGPGERLSRELRAGLFRAVHFAHARVLNALSIPNKDGKSPSQPGEPPRLRTGAGRRGVVWQVTPQGDAGHIYVSSTGWHLALLERGTRRVRPRPWLFATLQRYAAEIAEVARPI
jgi:hypothetical protein